jgi:molecular chaperone GrpE
MDETRNTEEHPAPADQRSSPKAGEQDRHQPTDPTDGQPASETGTGIDTARKAESAAGTVEGPSAAELQDRWQRAVAELDNVRKRYERQLDQARRAERDQVTAAWLPVLDHLELALQHAHADPATIVAGIQAVHKQALDVLAGLGYRRVDEVGARFDPQCCYAPRWSAWPAGGSNREDRAWQRRRTITSCWG